jgi:replicative superfamily II helicase
MEDTPLLAEEKVEEIKKRIEAMGLRVEIGR